MICCSTNAGDPQELGHSVSHQTVKGNLSAYVFDEPLQPVYFVAFNDLNEPDSKLFSQTLYNVDGSCCHVCSS